MRSANPPVQLAPIRAGEIDGRIIDLTADLGPSGDQIIDLTTVGIGILRQDGFPMTPADLAVAGTAWPLALDTTHLVLTIGLNAPTTAAGVAYLLTLTVNKTLQARLFIRDMTINVLAIMG